MVLLANSASIATRKNHFVSVCETKHPFFFHKNCTSRSTLEMSKNKQLTFAYYCILICGNCPVENTGNGISETLNLKIFWGSMPPDPTRLCHLCHYSFSSMHVCIFKISCYMYACHGTWWHPRRSSEGFSDINLRWLLERAREINSKLNTSKVNLKQTEVSFMTRSWKSEPFLRDP